jgi:O-antigen/teichoic acid export membrane protein
MSDNLGRQVTRGVLFATGSNYAIQALGLVSGIVLARLIAPEDFGVLALAMSIYAMFERLRTWGIDDLLIPKPDVTDEDLGDQLFLSGTLSVGVILLILVVRPLISGIYTPLVLDTLVILAFVRLFDIYGLSAGLFSYLRRELRYDTLARIELVTYIVSNMIGIGAALLGQALYALIALTASAELLRFAQLALALGRRPRFVWRPRVWWELMKRGSHLWMYNLGRHIAFNYGNLIVGTLAGELTLSFYSRAYSYAQMPMGLAVGIYTVMLPTYSRLRDDRKRLSQTVTLMLEAIGLVLFPVAMWLAFVAGPLLVFLLGERWAPVVPLLQMLLPFALMRPVLDALASLPIATGHLHIRSIAAVVEMVVMLVAGTGLTYVYGAPGAAVAAALVTALHLVTVYVLYLRHHLDVPYGRAIGLPGLTAGLALLAVLGVRSLLPDGFHALVNVGIETVAFGAAYLGLSWLFQRRVLLDRARLIIGLIQGQSGALASESSVATDPS